MKKSNYLLATAALLISLIVASCHEDKDSVANTCSVIDPIEELDWLKAHINSLSLSEDELSKYSYYMTATYKKETVFYYGNCHPAINSIFYVVNCKGETIGNLNDLEAQLSNKRLLWIPEGSKCNSND